MDEQLSLAQATAALSGYFLGDATMQETLARVSELALAAVGSADQVGITLIVNDKPGTYVFTDPEIAEVDQAQYESGDGPCLRASTAGEVVVVPSTSTSERFLTFCAKAAAHGFGSVMSIPLTVHTGPIGAANFYSRSEHAFGAEEIEVASRFGEQAALLLANAQLYWDARTLAENLEQAMRSRATIEQAKGIVMATTGADPDEAFQILRQQSQHQNIKLRDLAAEVVRHASRRPGQG